MHKIIYYRITKEANYVKEFSKYFKHQIYDIVMCACVWLHLWQCRILVS